MNSQVSFFALEIYFAELLEFYFLNKADECWCKILNPKLKAI